MSESHDRLRKTLEDLHAELADLQSLDGPSREMLQSAMTEIGDSLDDAEGEGLQESSTPELLSKAAQDFEVSHPQLARLVSNILDALGGIGI
jgi:hypothetical protein